MLALYRGATLLAGPALRFWLRRRMHQGKEAPERLGERFGEASLARPAGRLIWLHVASLGEARSGLALIDPPLPPAPHPPAPGTTGPPPPAPPPARRLPARARPPVLPPH